MDNWFAIGEGIFIGLAACALLLFIMDMCGKL